MPSLRQALQQLTGGGHFSSPDAKGSPGAGSKAENTAEACASQESDTFGSLEQLPEAGHLSSQIADGESQELPYEVEASGSQSQGQSQLSGVSSEPSEAEALQGNFPAVNVVPEKSQPAGKKGSANVARGAGKDKDGKDKDAKKKGGGGKVGVLACAPHLQMRACSLAMPCALRKEVPACTHGFECWCRHASTASRHMRIWGEH
jgi:hypothetical protein